MFLLQKTENIDEIPCFGRDRFGRIFEDTYSGVALAVDVGRGGHWISLRNGSKEVTVQAEIDEIEEAITEAGWNVEDKKSTGEEVIVILPGYSRVFF